MIIKSSTNALIEVVLAFMMIFIVLPGQKYYVVKDVLEKFTSKVGQFVEVMDIEEFGHAYLLIMKFKLPRKMKKFIAQIF